MKERSRPQVHNKNFKVIITFVVTSVRDDTETQQVVLGIGVVSIVLRLVFNKTVTLNLANDCVIASHTEYNIAKLQD